MRLPGSPSKNLRGLRDRLVDLEGHPDGARTGKKQVVLSLAFGMLLVCLAIVIMEAGQPFYFSQDDVLSGEMPMTLEGCRLVWQGSFPWYNPYTLMGTPLASLGGPGLTYPPTYIAYAVARHILGNEYTTMEVFAVLHLLLGYLCLFWAARRLGLGPVPSMLTALSFCLSGGILIIGRSWHSFMPLAVWLPLLVVSVTGIRSESMGWKWILGTGAMIGISYQVGFPQIWAYTIGFFGIAAAWTIAANRSYRSLVPRFIAAVGIGAALVLPLFLLQIKGTASMVRGSGYGGNIAQGIGSLFLPYPLAVSPHPNAWGNAYGALMGQMYYSGTLLFSLGAVVLLALLTMRPKASVWRDKPWLVCGLIAFLGALGFSGPVWPLLVRLPVLGRINNHPFRLIPFVIFFVVLTGGVALERLLRTAKNRRFAESLVSLCAIALVFYHVALARASFYAYGFPPYPKLPAEFSRAIRGPENGGMDWRVLPVAPLRSPDHGYFLSMSNNLPLVYGIYSFAGYDPIIENSPPWSEMASALGSKTLESARAYGLRWMLVYRPSAPRYGSSPVTAMLERRVPVGFVIEALRLDERGPVLRSGNVDLYELADASPLAFSSNAPAVPLPFKPTGAGLEVDVSSVKTPTDIILNFAWRPEARAAVDRARAPIERDPWQRIRVRVSGRASSLKVTFVPPWLRGVVIGLATLTFSLLLAATILRRAKRRTSPPRSD